jgi:hypothetical protein
MFNGDDVVNDLVNDKALVNVNATETTEVVGDATSLYAWCINAQHVK